MPNKLTLSINEDVIKKAKQVSRRRGKSLSKMVEEYLKTFSEKEAQEESLVARMKKIMEPYKHKLTLPEEVSYKEVIRQGRYNDYIKKTKTIN